MALSHNMNTMICVSILNSATKKGYDMPVKCEQCGEVMNPISAAISKVCIKCVDKNHKEATK